MDRLQRHREQHCLAVEKVALESRSDGGSGAQFHADTAAQLRRRRAFRRPLARDSEQRRADYGGSGQGNMGGVDAAPIPLHGRRWSINLTLPPLGAVFLIPDGTSDIEEAAAELALAFAG